MTFPATLTTYTKEYTYMQKHKKKYSELLKDPRWQKLWLKVSGERKLAIVNMNPQENNDG